MVFLSSGLCITTCSCHAFTIPKPVSPGVTGSYSKGTHLLPPVPSMLRPQCRHSSPPGPPLRAGADGGTDAFHLSHTRNTSSHLRKESNVSSLQSRHHRSPICAMRNGGAVSKLCVCYNECAFTAKRDVNGREPYELAEGSDGSCTALNTMHRHRPSYGSMSLGSLRSNGLCQKQKRQEPPALRTGEQ